MGGKVSNLVRGYTDTNTKVTINILQRKWRKSLFWKRRDSEKTSMKIENSFCRGICEAKLLLCALHEQHLILFRSSIHSSMALQPFDGPWPLLQFRNLFYTDGMTPWTGDQPLARPLPTHRTTQTQNKRAHRHPCLEWIRTHDPSVRASEDISCLRPRGHCERRYDPITEIKWPCEMVNLIKNRPAPDTECCRLRDIRFSQRWGLR
jgi:hypothetical protein